jgi:hypothetical protein
MWSCRFDSCGDPRGIRRLNLTEHSFERVAHALDALRIGLGDGLVQLAHQFRLERQVQRRQFARKLRVTVQSLEQ